MNIDYETLFSLDPEEFAAEMVKIQSLVKPLHIEYKTLKSINDLSFDAVKKYIKPEPNRNFARYIFFDEREDEVYANEKGRRPFGGRYDFITCEPAYLPFGIVEVAIRGFYISRKASDFKHPHMEKAFEERNHFYYDFTEHHYVQVNLEKSKNPNTVEFITRKNQAAIVERKMKKFGKLYYKAYDDILGRLKVVVGSKKKDMIAFLEGVKEFLAVDFPKGLLARLIMSEVDSEEYNILLKEVAKYLVAIDEHLKHLNSLESVGGDFDFSDLVEMDPRIQILKDVESFRLGIVKVLFVPRPEKKPDYYNLTKEDGSVVQRAVGYLYDEESDILCPNIAELERRAAYYSKSANPLSEQEIVKEIREKIK